MSLTLPRLALLPNRFSSPSPSLPCFVSPAPVHPGRRQALRTLAWGALGWSGGAWALPEAQPRVLDFEWTDERRQREVPARLYLPAEDTGPLVVFSHGIGGSRWGYSYIGRHLAGHGVACLHLQHVGSDRSLWGGNVLQRFDRWRRAISNTEAMARAQDLSFGLDRFAKEGLPFKASTIVAAGHSYGANTALLVAGAKFSEQLALPPLLDARVRAAVLLSAPPFYGVSDLSGTVAPIGLPSLHITTTQDVIKIPGYESPASDRVAVFDAMSGPKALMVFAQGSHSIFTDRITAADGPELNAVVKQGTRDVLLAFVQGVQARQPTAGLQAAAQPHQGALARFVVKA
jgi:predicted dienelactone hydrolase